MTTTPADAPARSRLEPPAIPRRDFLGLAALWSALATLGFAALGALRLPRAAVVPVPSRKFAVALPETLGPGEAFLPPGRAVALFRDATGVWALSAVCTHLGCIVKREGDGFSCPCHGSKFAADGAVEKGPAPAGLPWLAVTKGDADRWIVDEGTIVPAGTKASA